MKIFILICILCVPSISYAQAKKQTIYSGNDKLGICAHFDQGWNINLMDDIAKLNVGWIRDGIEWSAVEKSKGIYVIPPEKLVWIKHAHIKHLKLLLILNGSNNLYEDIYNKAAFSNFAIFMAKTLQNDVDAFEILNEPANFGFSKFYGGTWNGIEGDKSTSNWVVKYNQLLNFTALKIKTVNSKVKVIGLGSVPPVNFKQISLGINAAVDGIADHPYSDLPETVQFNSSKEVIERDGIATADLKGTFKSQIILYNKQSALHKGPKEIWLTEFGFPTYIGAKKSLLEPVTEEQQCKYLLRRCIESLGLNVNHSFYYTLTDGPDRSNPEDNFGLLRANGSEKQSYKALKTLASVINGYDVNNKANLTIKANNGKSIAGIKYYAFKKGKYGQYYIWITGTKQINCNLSINSIREVKNVYLTNLIDGSAKKVGFKQINSTITINNVQISDFPALIQVR